MKSRVALALPLLLVVPIVFPVLLISVIAGFGAESPAAACDTVVPATGAETVGDAHLDAEQMQVATQIVGVVRAFPATSTKPQAAVVALATTRQESGIRNLDYGDRDSLGAFQQRPSQGWGTPDQVRNVLYATTSFLKRLVKVPGWETMRVTDAAATVQRPAEEYEGLYEQWVPLATGLTERLWGSGTAAGSRGEEMRLNLTGETAATGLFAQNAGCVVTGGGSVPANCSARGGAAEAGLTPDALRVMRCALTVFGPHVVGGVGERPNPSDHTTGRAVDVMIAGWDTPAGNAEGWEIAQWAQDNAKQLGVTYVIFDAKIWSVDRNAEGWRAYTHPTGSSNPTLDHLDHVHASVRGNAGSDTPIAVAGEIRPLTGKPRVASFNVLGHSHTVAGGERPGMAEGPQRMRWATQLLYDQGISVAGLQEFQPPQVREFKRLVGSAWGMFPGAGRDNVNAVVWRTDTWELVSAQSYPFPYFHGRTMRAPVVLLRHRASGQAVWFTNHHNPADAQGPAAHWRREATRMEITYTRGLLRTGYPVVVTGDMNERDIFYCRFTARADMQAANGGSNSNGRCRPPAQTQIDWIFGSRQVRFSNYQALRNEQVRRTTDHPLVVATMDVAG
jgi:hypothetical protein